MQKIDGKAILEEAEKAGLVYPIKPGWRKFMVFAGVLLCLLVLTAPLGIWFFFISRKARAGVGKDGLAVKWFTTTAYAWSDMEKVEVGQIHMNAGGGIVGALAGAAAGAVVAANTDGVKGPLSIKLKGKWLPIQIPAHQLQGSVGMVREMEARTGLAILPQK